MERLFGLTLIGERRILAGLATLERETDQSLDLTMHSRTAWDPYSRPTMTVRDLYHYETEHYEHHRRQLTRK